MDGLLSGRHHIGAFWNRSWKEDRNLEFSLLYEEDNGSGQFGKWKDSAHRRICLEEKSIWDETKIKILYSV